MAEGSDNEAERDAFMVRAQELSTLYSISLATARAHDTKKRNATTPLTRVVSIGERGKHGLKNYVELICEIARANNTKLTIAHNSTFVTLYGFVEDIDLTITLYGSLLGQMVAASERWLATGAYKTEMDLREVTRRDAFGRSYKDFDYAPVPKQTARAIFQVAFADRIGTRLQTAQKDTTAQAITADEQSGTASTALVLAEKTRQVEKFYQDNNDARGHYKGVSMTGWSESAHQAGRKAADSARLHRSTEIGTPKAAIR
ncbi:DUF2786 domain-containing protein [Mycobacterium hodleri]|nr:DUF2786 domain-containing protein [Mycolicibacterium hodleri]